MMKYAIKLTAYGIQFWLREAKKAQVIVDFVIEYTGPAKEIYLSTKRE